MKEKLKKKMRKIVNFATLVSLIFNVGAFTVYIPQASAAPGLNSSVDSLILVDPVTDTELYEITDGGVVNLSDLSDPSKVNIKANVSGTDTPGSVHFDLDSGAWTRNEGAAPYALFGDSAGNYVATHSILAGAHNLAVTPYSGTGGSGIAGTGLDIDFTVVNFDAPTLVSPEDGAMLNYDNPTLSWTADEGDEFAVNIEGPNGFTEQFLAVSPYPHGTLPYEGEYSWKVRVVEDGEFGEWSETRIFTIDTTAPTFNAVSISSDNPTSTLAKVGDTVSVELEAVEEISEPTVTINGNPSVLFGSGTTYTATYQMTDADTEGQVTFEVSGYEDLAGNPGAPVLATTDDSSVVFDMTGPEATKDSKLDVKDPTNNANPTAEGKFDPSQIVSTQVEGQIPTPNYEVSKVQVVFDNGTDTYTKDAKLDYDTGEYTTAEDADYAKSVNPSVVESLDKLPDGTYKVTAYAFDKAGNSTPEVIDDAFVVDTVKPEVVQNLTITAKTADSVSLKWNETVDNLFGTGVVGYRVYYGTAETGYTGVRDVGNVTEATIGGLNANTQYYFYVVAYDKAQNQGSASNEVVDKTYEKPVIVASASPKPPAGVVESAQDENLPATGGEEKKEEKKDENKGGMSWIWFLVIAMLAGGGYYYYVNNPALFSKWLGGGPKPPIS